MRLGVRILFLRQGVIKGSWGFLKFGFFYLMQELLDRLGDFVLESQVERMILEFFQQDRGFVEVSEIRGVVFTGVFGFRTKVFQVLRGLRSFKMMRNSGCFGRRLDRIGFFSGLGCNGEYLFSFLLCFIIRVIFGFDVFGDYILREGYLDIIVFC